MKYLWDNELNLFRCSDPGDFTYSDGVEVEARLLSIVSAASDRSTFSPELVRAITDWPSEYHLSRSRHCLVRPLGIHAGTSVLELGCGCGAVTRYLGEVGANVVAVEGSLPRARVAAERCRGMDNVRVVVDDFLQFATDERFDYVLLIGVLEYAAVFSRSDDPFEHYLRSVTRFLAPGGRVVVAIENKLGLKYFNGCGEDHVGVPFFGIQNLYEPGMVRTFGRQELREQLCAAGLPHTYFSYPFPDYKLPSAILTEDGMKGRGFEAIDLLVRSHARDYSSSPYRSFDDALAFSALANNSLLADLSNSFLVVATAEAASNPSSAELARTFSIHRAPEFCTQTRFVDCGDRIRVLKEPLTSARAQPIQLPDDMTVSHHVGESTYQPGRQLLWGLLEARARSSDLEGIVQALRPWMAFLLQRARIMTAQTDGDSPKRASLAAYELPGEFLDCTPFNVLANGEQMVAIDLEWQSDRPVSLGWVLTRGIVWSVTSGKLWASHLHKVTSVLEALCRSFELAVSEAEVQAWFDLEVVFQNQLLDLPCEVLTTSRTITGFETFTDEIATLRQQNQQTVTRGQITSLRKIASEQAIQIATLSQLTATRSEQIAELSRKLEDSHKSSEHAASQGKQLRAETAVRDSVRLRSQLSAVEKQLEDIRTSTAWRLTAPLRFLGKVSRSRYRTLGRMKSDRQLIAQSGLFDSAWYLSQYPDVAASGVDPIVHYLQFGAGEGRDPSENFVTNWYLEQYADVAAAGINPLVHYLLYGTAEGRKPTPVQSTVAAPVVEVHDVFDYVKTPIDRSALPVNVAIGVSSLGNFFMTEIGRMLECAFRQLGAQARLFTERDYHSVSYDESVVVVAPHEFFLLGYGPDALEHLKRHPHPVMLNTEQPQTPWFSDGQRFLSFSKAVVDINYKSAKYLADRGYNAFFLPLGHSEYISNTFDSGVLPKHELFSYMKPSIRDAIPRSYSERPIDLLFIGTASPRRHEFFARNAAFFASKNSFIYMPDGHTPFLQAQPKTIDFAAFVAIARRSKVLLNIHRNDIPYMEWQRIATLGIMQKTLVITDPCEPGPCLEANLDYLEAPLAGLPALCELALGNDQAAGQIAERAYDRLKATCSLKEIVGKCWTAIARDLDGKPC